MSDKGLQDIEDKRLQVNHRIGVYSIWVVLIGVGIALSFFGEGMEPGKRWGIMALVILYVSVRLAFMRRKSKN